LKKAARQKRRIILLSSAVLLLVSCGLTLIFQVFSQNERVLLQNEDRQLLALAESVDYSIAGYLKRCSADLDYLTEQRSFLEAEALWLETDDSSGLLSQLRESQLAQHDTAKAVLVIQNREVLFSSDGATDYRFPGEDAITGDISVRPCTGPDGSPFLAFLKQNDSGVGYAALLDLPLLYQRVAGNLTTGAQEQVMLLDANGTTLLYHTPDGIRVDRIDPLSDETREASGFRLLQERHTQTQMSTAFYEADASDADKSYTARMAILPAAAGSNGYFSISVSNNYDQFISPIRRAAIRLVIYGSMVAAGVLLLFFLVLQSNRRTRQVMREVAALREKNTAMEALNTKTQELAHHQRLETIGTLTSSIAHEFNNLLTPIMGYSILALEKLPPEETEIYDSLLEIYSSSRKAKDIISRLSDLSRKNTSLTYQYISPDELVRRVMEVARPACPSQVEMRAELNCRHLWLHGNETQLSQVLLNLVLNAFHAMETSGGTLTLSTGADETNILFRVQDTGCGIAPEVLPHIFDPFFTTKEGGKGTGLGLAIVQQVIEDHQGRIEVETSPGQGTTFSIAFPMHTRQKE